MGKQPKIPFVQAFFIVGRQSGVAGDCAPPALALGLESAIAEH
jgi:hypothetical protein